MPPRKKKVRAEAGSRGLDARRLAAATPPASVTTLAERIEEDGGGVLATYRDPLGSHWQLLAALPLDRVEPTPYQRNLSEPHVERLTKAMEKVGRFLDPVIAVPAANGKYWSPNGFHRIGALRLLGTKAIVAIVVPDTQVAHRILALNTEKARTTCVSGPWRWLASPKAWRRSTTGPSASSKSSLRKHPS